MPIYEYLCEDCGHALEALQKNQRYASAGMSCLQKGFIEKENFGARFPLERFRMV